MSDFKWQNPPGERRGGREVQYQPNGGPVSFVKLASRLTSQRRKWARIVVEPDTKRAHTTAFNLRNGILGGELVRERSFEFVARGNRVYGRYLGRS